MPCRILVVDDVEPQRELYAREFQEEGYVVTAVATGEEAVEKLREAAPDLVILDMSMPGMGGLKTLGLMLRARPELPVVICTAYGTYRDSFMTWAAAAYVLKSPDLTELKRAVREALAERRSA